MKIALILAVLVLSAAPFAQKSARIKCAVMQSMQVTVKDATKAKQYVDYKGRRYYFCCGGCPIEFKKNPAKYAKNASLPVPKKG